MSCVFRQQVSPSDSRIFEVLDYVHSSEHFEVHTRPSLTKARRMATEEVMEMVSVRSSPIQLRKVAGVIYDDVDDSTEEMENVVNEELQDLETHVPGTTI